MEKQLDKTSTIKGRLACHGQRVVLSISDGKIANISPNGASYESNEEELFIAAGLIDNQVNGYMGIDFSEPGLTIEKVEKVTRALWKKGVTSYLPTLITSSRAQLTENLSVLRNGRLAQL